MKEPTKEAENSVRIGEEISGKETSITDLYFRRASSAVLASAFEIAKRDCKTHNRESELPGLFSAAAGVAERVICDLVRCRFFGPFSSRMESSEEWALSEILALFAERLRSLAEHVEAASNGEQSDLNIEIEKHLCRQCGEPTLMRRCCSVACFQSARLARN